MKSIRLLLLLLCVAVAVNVDGNEPIKTSMQYDGELNFSQQQDTVTTDLQAQTSDTIISKTEHKSGLVQRIIDYLETSNKPKEQKNFDFSMLGGPHYSSSTNFGVGLVAAGLYKRNLADTVTPPSYVSVYADVTVKLYFKVGVEGYQILKNGRWRVIYDVSFLSNPTKFWGIGYANGNNSDNETEYKKWQVSANVDFLRNIGDKLYFGPGVKYNYSRACDIEGDTHLWEGQRLHSSNIGVGASLAYDTRDDLNDAYSGVYLKLSQLFYPKFFENRYAFSSSEVTFCWYQPVSSSGLIATRVHGMFTYGNTPWGMMPMLGDNETMRGYYEGHYIDKNLVDVTVEWRQHIYKRHSAVCWIGTGEVFSNTDCFSFDKLLPNAGVGYRWEFKKRVNVRLDLGFGRKQTGVIFSVNEAF
jgi:hypothetical protein